MITPLVSIIVPCYNQGKYINETLQSVYDQTYTNWECIIVDDGSTDDSEQIIAGFTAKDDRFIYVYKKNGGVSSARNVAIETSQGQFIQFLDSDDILDYKKLQYSVNELNNNKNVQIVITNFKMISSDSKEIYPAFCEITNESLTFENFLFNSFSIQLQCGFFDKKLFENIRFPENLSALEDWIVWVRILKDKPNYIFIDLPLAFYRINPSGRMNTLGADDNPIKVLDCLKSILTYDQYHKFSVRLLSRYYDSMKLYRNNLTHLKKSKAYKAELIIKKSLNKFKIACKIIKLWFFYLINNPFVRLNFNLMKLSLYKLKKKLR